MSSHKTDRKMIGPHRQEWNIKKPLTLTNIIYLSETLIINQLKSFLIEDNIVITFSSFFFKSESAYNFSNNARVLLEVEVPLSRSPRPKELFY